MPPLNIQSELIKPNSLQMDNEYLRENLSQQELVRNNVEGTSDENISSNTRQGLSRTQIITVSILCFVNLINYMDRYTIAGLLHDIGNEFNLSDGQKGLLQTVFIIVYMVMAPLYGYLGDRYNRRILMCTGVFIWSLTTLLGSFMPNYGLFLLMRCFVGIGEASYSTIAPTILSDYFVNDMRSKMLAFFYFAIPVGSGLGYIIGAEVCDLAKYILPEDQHFDAWRWGLRVTPVLGLVAVFLLYFFLKEPPRGEIERAEHLKPTNFKSDIKYLLLNRSYILGTIGFTCVTYVAGALAWWGPVYVEYGAEVQKSPNVQPHNISLVFGFIAMLAGIIGVPLGSIAGQKLRVRYPSADPVVCGVGLALSMPLVMIGIMTAGTNTIVAFLIVFLGQIFMNLNWAVVSDMILYIVIPTRRSSATAFQILFSHTFGDAGSPYIVGLVAEAFKPYIRGSDIDVANTTVNSILNTTTSINTTTSNDVSPSDLYIQFKSLQYSLIICVGVLLFAAAFFFWTAVYIRRDKEKCDNLIAGAASVDSVSNVVAGRQRLADETEIEQRHRLLIT